MLRHGKNGLDNFTTDEERALTVFQPSSQIFVDALVRRKAQKVFSKYLITKYSFLYL